MKFQINDKLRATLAHLRELGISVAYKGTLTWDTKKWPVTVEPNVNISSKTAILQVRRIGAFTYINGGRLYVVESIGRFCSFAQNIYLGPANHPSTFLSTSPFQYSIGMWPASSDMAEFYERNKPLITQLSKTRQEACKINSTITIGNDVWIGENVTVNRGVIIGDGAIVAGGSIVTKDVEPYSIVGGIPAKHIRYRFPEEIRTRLSAVQWWDYGLTILDGIDFSNIDLALVEIEKRARDAEPYAPDTVTISPQFETTPTAPVGGRPRTERFERFPAPG